MFTPNLLLTDDEVISPEFALYQLSVVAIPSFHRVVVISFLLTFNAATSLCLRIYFYTSRASELASLGNDILLTTYQALQFCPARYHQLIKVPKYCDHVAQTS